MVDVAPEFETTDGLGKTQQLAGTVGLAAIAIGSLSEGPIEELLVRCPKQTPNTKVLSWSLDNVTFHELSVGEFVGWEPRKNSSGTDFKQVFIKANVASTKYELIINRGQ